MREKRIKRERTKKPNKNAKKHARNIRDFTPEILQDLL